MTEKELKRFERGKILKHSIDYIDENLSLLDKKHYVCIFEDGRERINNCTFTYSYNDSTIGDARQTKAIKAYLNSLKEDLIKEFKEL